MIMNGLSMAMNGSESQLTFGLCSEPKHSSLLTGISKMILRLFEQQNLRLNGSNFLKDSHG